MSKPIDAVLALLATLSDKEKDRVRGMLQVVVPACSRMGHNYKATGQTQGLFTRTSILVCTRCGKQVTA